MPLVSPNVTEEKTRRSSMITESAIHDILSPRPSCQEQGGKQEIFEMTHERLNAQEDLYKAVFLMGVKLGIARFIENEKEF